MKEFYLCNIDDEERRSAVGSGKYLSGLRKFPRCPARKKIITNNPLPTTN